MPTFSLRRFLGMTGALTVVVAGIALLLGHLIPPAVQLSIVGLLVAVALQLFLGLFSRRGFVIFAAVSAAAPWINRVLPEQTNTPLGLAIWYGVIGLAVLTVWLYNRRRQSRHR